MEIRVPAVGESISEATVGEWFKKSGDFVEKDEAVLSLETDKASVEVVAEAPGQVQIEVDEGQTVAIGALLGHINTQAQAPETPSQTPSSTPKSPLPPPPPQDNPTPSIADLNLEDFSPAVRHQIAQNNLDPSQIQGTGPNGRILKSDVVNFLKTSSSQNKPDISTSAPAPLPPKQESQKSSSEATPPSLSSGSLTPQNVDRVPMTTLRKKIAERLVSAQREAAILTTFNEVDMSEIMTLRKAYKDSFEKKHGVRLGFMGFFVKAAIEALKAFPAVNASIDGTDILYKDFCNVGIAVSTPKGLVVPVLKGADEMSLPEIEKNLAQYADKARQGQLSIEDMSGGTFTISNGGVFGSLMSTPILNPPQSGILGMHKIEDRPVVVNGEVVVKPMMYLALSYDHRMIDGRESVSFLVQIKKCIEDPSRILLQV